MATKNKKATRKFFTLENAIDTVSLVNTVALSSTEKVFTKTFGVVEKWQSSTDKILKKGLKFSAKKQDAAFDLLESSKEKAVTTLKKVTKKVA